MHSTLHKGFAYLKEENGKIIEQAKDLKTGSLVSVTLKDGSKDVKVEG